MRHAEIVPKFSRGANVNHHRCIPLWRALLACGALVVAAPAALLAADTPAASGTAHSDKDDAEMEAQLETARRNLEQAARDVAELSAQLSTRAIDESTRAIDDAMPMLEPGRAIIGVQLERAADGKGARVREVSPGGPAADAGIRTGDVIVAVNGATITGADPTRQVLGILHNVKPDTKVNVRVLRDGKAQDLTLTTRASPGLFARIHGLPDMGQVALPALPELRGDFMFHRPLMDMELATLTPRLGSYFGTDKGVLVVRAPANDALKLEDGDVILTIDGRQPTSGSHATRILGSYQPGEKVTLRILRDHKTLQYETTLPDRPAPTHRDLTRGNPSPAGPPVQPRKVVLFGNNLA
jgi:predicted metalloprotease with PDZ domain